MVSTFQITEHDTSTVVRWPSTSSNEDMEVIFSSFVLRLLPAAEVSGPLFSYSGTLILDQNPLAYENKFEQRILNL